MWRGDSSTVPSSAPRSDNQPPPPPRWFRGSSPGVARLGAPAPNPPAETPPARPAPPPPPAPPGAGSPPWPPSSAMPVAAGKRLTPPAPTVNGLKPPGGRPHCAARRPCRYRVIVVILATGATGRVGYRLLEALADARADVTAMVRVQAKAEDLPGTPQHVVATFDGPPPAEVLRGFHRVFLLSPAIEEQAELETVFIDALVAAGHGPHVVKVAADGFADPGCEVRFMVTHRRGAARPG